MASISEFSNSLYFYHLHLNTIIDIYIYIYIISDNFHTCFIPTPHPLLDIIPYPYTTISITGVLASLNQCPTCSTQIRPVQSNTGKLSSIDNIFRSDTLGHLFFLYYVCLFISHKCDLFFYIV